MLVMGEKPSPPTMRAGTAGCGGTPSRAAARRRRGRSGLREAPRVTLTCTRSLHMPNACGRIWETEVRARYPRYASILRRWSSAVLAAMLTIGLGGCGNTDSWVDASPAQGWPAQYADASNSSYTTTTGATRLALTWTRSVKGSLAAGPALSAGPAAKLPLTERVQVSASFVAPVVVV